jgi:dynein heavy chain, axonemal
VAGSSSSARDDRIKQILDEVLERLPEEFSLPEICSRLEEKTPFMVVIIQECERMNALISEAKRSLRELDKGLKGELSLTPDMEEMTNSLYLDQVPHRWAKLAYPSLLGLTAWIADLQHRHKELDTWLVDFQMPNSVWLGGFFSPQVHAFIFF